MAINGKLPDNLAVYAPDTTPQLVGGTYSMANAMPLNIGGERIACNTIMFANALVPNEPPGHLEIGTLNPSALGQSNQIVLLVMHRTGRKPSIAGCWVPDGGAGRYMVEQNELFINDWYGYGKAARRAVRRSWLAIFLRISPARFLFPKWIAAALAAHPHSKPTPAARLQTFGAHIMKKELFMKEYGKAFGAASPSADSNENSLL